MAKPWFRSRAPERGGGFDITSWQGAMALAAFALLLVIGVLSIILSGASLLGISAAAICAIGGTYWLVRMIRAHGEPDA